MVEGLSFTAIDFETATANQNSACAIGLVVVEHGLIVDEFHSLIRPPGNQYMWQTTRVHGIKPRDTFDSPTFEELYFKIKPLIANRMMVAHNELFDRNVLRKTMLHYSLPYESLGLSNQWECTFKIYQSKGFKPARLNACCEVMGIDLNHHEALSDARACAELFLMHKLEHKK
ncbi:MULTISPECIES: 3'-5' exonuclease [Sphingobacterium]|jgi:DNA polymerase-3 subunit epsilon|uniref:3'-5' exonuclease n=2 Tax=Sphingobacterium TaxID=28453 RepID=A0ACD5BWH6_9SPHI|nr:MULTISPECIES: 3'-5' exonuclease [Sphingobacterium]QQT43590.1 3'-5' exonuclease [Sphingobacterium multivorum]SUI97910.1 DNA polymerase III polC-type [Sphingobacterium multivorum]VXC32663.1 DNA polymerase III polC-type [Sphingobacterium multivorum]HAE66804.1 DNA polymerase III subunit epsilon [Sphingobacterium sp.]